MRKEIADLWVAELRSGKYQQGKMNLRSADNTYCCLGVLCELAMEHGVSIKRIDNEDHSTYGKGWGDDQSSGLPQRVQQWSGMHDTLGDIDTGAPRIIGGTERYSLSSSNDNGDTFEDIADYIEQNWQHI